MSFAIRVSLLHKIPESSVSISERLITWHIPLTKNRNATLISANALETALESKETFYASLNSAIGRTPDSSLGISMQKQALRAGYEGESLISTVLARSMIKASAILHSALNTSWSSPTLFDLKDKLKTSWQHPRCKYWHLLDYIIVRSVDRKEVFISRAIRGADCWTDHQLIRAKLRMDIHPQLKKTPAKKRLNCGAQKSKHCVDQFRVQLATNLSAIPDTTSCNSQGQKRHK